MSRSHSRLSSYQFFGLIALALLLASPRLSAGTVYWNDNPSFAFSTEQIGSYDSSLIGLGCSDGKLLAYGSYSVVNGVFVGIKPVRINADGSLDQTFQAPSYVSVLAVQADGRCYVLDKPNSPSVTNRIRRLNVDGSVDATFAAVTLDYDAYGLLVLSNGQLVLYGNFSAVNSVTQRSLVRLNADGSRDTSFQSPFAATSNYITSLAEDPSGKLLVAGYSFSFGTGREKLVRLNADGSVDTNWVVTGDTGSGSATVKAVTANSSVLADFGSGLVRLDATGAPDSTFSLATTGSSVSSFSVTRDGLIYYSSVDDTNTRRFRRLLLDGTADNTFPPVAASSVIPAGNGLFYLVSDTPHLQARQPLLHATADGTPDSNFTPPRLSRPGNLSTFAIQPDGKILVAGAWSYANGIATTDSLSLVRLLPDGSSDTSFHATLPTGYVYQILVQPSGHILIFGSFSNSTKSVVRLAANGDPDGQFPLIKTSFNSPMSPAYNPVAVDASGSFYVATGSSSNLVRYLSDGTLDTSFNTGGITSIGTVAPTPDGRMWVLGGNKLFRLTSAGGVDTTFSAVSLTSPIGLVAFPDGSALVTEELSGTLAATDFLRIRRFSSSGQILMTFQNLPGNISPGISSNQRMEALGVAYDVLRSLSGSSGHLAFSLAEPGGRSWSHCDASGRIFDLGRPYNGNRGLLYSFTRSSTPGPSFPAAPALIRKSPLNGSYTLLPINTTRTLSVEMAGLQPFDFQWSKDGNAIGTNSASYSANIANSSSAGTFQVVASNAYGSSQPATFTLTVDANLVGAKITTPLQNATVALGGHIVFTVSAVGSPAPSYQWYLNDATITGATTSSLELTSVTAAANGRYRVRVSNLAQNSGGIFTFSDTSECSLAVLESPFDEWRATYFNSSELLTATLSAPSADPDADGLSNLAEYALGLDPRTPSPGGGLTVTNNGTDWIVTYSRPTDRSELAYRLERSTNLADWSDAGLTPELVSRADGIDTWRATYPVAGASSCFFRLVVTR